MNQSAPKPRTPRLGFADVPKRWFGGSIAATQVANGVNLLFPAGERFFVRSVKHYLDELDDPELVAQVRGFFGQEGRQGRQRLGRPAGRWGSRFRKVLAIG